MRKIDTSGARLARRGISRQVNRQVVLTLVREHQPVSRVDSARRLGVRLAGVVHAVTPARIYMGGEITAAWPLMDEALHVALGARALTPAAAATPVVPDTSPHPRLHGTTTLVAAPTFSAPELA